MNEATRKNAFRMTLLCTAALAATAWAGGDPGSKFDSMDANKDGMVSAAEHAAAVTTMFGEMDANADGMVSAQEMDARHDTMHAATAETRTMNDASDYGGGGMHHEMTSAEKIASMDTDGDGMLTSAEHDAGAASMFSKMDTDGNGSLSKQEMSVGAAMKHH
jgi:hypothetical protein